jgi:flagellar hook-associated protein 2
MAGLSIPGVSDKYKTNDYIEALMAKERIPLTREQDALDRYKDQQSAWRGVNQKMNTLRESVKNLYSFDNPFNNKLASSSDENAITADAGRDAEYDSIKIDVVQPASTDRFLSGDIDKNSTVPAGTYTYTVADKTISMNWHGGKLTDFVSSLNKRGNGVIKASLIGVSSDKQSLLIESLKTGSANSLIFKDAALDYALGNDMVQPVRAQITELGSVFGDLKSPPAETADDSSQAGLPAISTTGISVISKTITVPPRTGFSLPVPSSLSGNENEKFEFTLGTKDVADITTALNEAAKQPELPDAGSAGFAGIIVSNRQSETTLSEDNAPREQLVPVKNDAHIYVRNKDGTEQEINTSSAPARDDGKKTISMSVSQYPDIDSIVVRNKSTGTALELSTITAYDEKAGRGFEPVHPVNTAEDAIIKYEGITIIRPTNKIDDVVPHVTLNVAEKTEKTAIITIKPDKEAAKDALIKFVGNYNQVISEMNILSENKPEIVTELDYLSKDEQDAANKRLGMFQGDFSLSNTKASMQSITSGSYRWEENAPITMLSQIGISTRAVSSAGGYAPGQLRGYLEIDEKKLDSNLDTNLDSIKNIFGYDSDGDLIVDSGIGYALDKQLTSWVQSGGILSNKTGSLDTKVKLSETNIKKLQDQLDTKEEELKEKYGQMEGTLNSLESQSATINNFSNSGKN